MRGRRVKTLRKWARELWAKRYGARLPMTARFWRAIKRVWTVTGKLPRPAYQVERVAPAGKSTMRVLK